MEKKKPTYDLASLKADFSDPTKLNVTYSARGGADALGMTSEDIVRVIQKLERSHFYKSMTTFAGAQLWQDVYKIPYGPMRIYVKFMLDKMGNKLLVSFKEA